MVVTVVRKTGWVGSLFSLFITVNGKKIGSVGETQYVQAELLTTPAHMRVSRFGAKSNVLEVQDGDTVEITNTIAATISRILLVVWIILLNFQQDPWRSPITIALLIGILLVSFFSEEYRIEKRF